MSEIMETVSSFSKRTGLPVKIIRLMARQGQIPHIKTGKSHIRIHIEGGLEAIKQHSQITAAEIAATMPVPIHMLAPIPAFTAKPSSVARKYRGRPPDSVRLAKK